MATRPATIRKADLKRTLEALRDAGLTIQRVRVKGSEFEVITNDGAAPPEEGALEAWRREHGQG